MQFSLRIGAIIPRIQNWGFEPPTPRSPTPMLMTSSSELCVCVQGPVYSVQWSPFNSNVFLSSSTDWDVKIWHQDSPHAAFSLTSPLVSSHSSVIFVLIHFLLLVLVFQLFFSFSFVLVLQYFFVLALQLFYSFCFVPVLSNLLTNTC